MVEDRTHYDMAHKELKMVPREYPYLADVLVSIYSIEVGSDPKHWNDKLTRFLESSQEYRVKFEKELKRAFTSDDIDWGSLTDTKDFEVPIEYSYEGSDYNSDAKKFIYNNIWKVVFPDTVLNFE